MSSCCLPTLTPCLSAANLVCRRSAPDYVASASKAQVRTFLQQRGMPLGEAPADYFGSLLMATSWLENQSQEDEVQAQITLFNEYLLPWCDRFLGNLTAHATSDFYRTLAQFARKAIQMMRDELAEYAQDEKKLPKRKN